MSRILQVFCSLLSGALLALAIPNEAYLFGSPAVGLVSILPLYLAVSNSTSYRFTFLLCFIQAAVCHIFSSFWLGNFQGFAAFTLGASDVGTGFILAFISLFMSFPAVFENRSSRLMELSGKKPFWISFRAIWFSAAYVIYEWCKSTGFLAYSWGTVSMTAFRWSYLTQIADITGVWGVTFLFVFFSACLGEGINLISIIPHSSSPKRLYDSFLCTFRCCMVLIAVSAVYGICQKNIQKERKPAKTMNTVLVQHNNDAWSRFERFNILTSQRLSKEGFDFFEEQKKKTDLIVWSEAVLSKRFPTAEKYYKFYPEEEPLTPFIAKLKTPFIIGGPTVIDAKKADYGNSALLFDEKGVYKGRYIKMHLVPFAELIPGRQYEAVRRAVKSVIGSYGWAPGKKVVLFEIPLKSSQPEEETDFDTISIVKTSGRIKEKPSVKFSTPICFDDAAGEVCRAMHLCGSELFVNITNDSWSKTKSAETQHFVVAHYRCIEYRTTMIRAANAGFTTVIGPSGNIIDALPMFQEGSLNCTVPIYRRQMTIYARFGNWLPYAAMLLMAGFIAKTVSQAHERESEEKEITTERIKHSLEWYELYEHIMSVYDEVFAIDWNNWNC